MTNEQKIKYIQNQINQIDNLVGKNHKSSEFIKWKTETEIVIRNVYHGNPSCLQEFKALSFQLVRFRLPGAVSPDMLDLNIYEKDIEKSRAILEGIIFELKNFSEQSSETNKASKIIKKTLEDKDLWVESRIDGEDTHFFIGRKKEDGKKVHVIIDGRTGEIRVEDSQKPPEDIVEKIDTIFKLHDGRTIHNTREVLEWSKQSSNQYNETISSIPVIEVSGESSVNNLGNQESINIYLVNKTLFPLIILSCHFDGIETDHGSKKLDTKDVFHFRHFNKQHLNDGYQPEFQLIVRMQTGKKYKFVSRLLIKNFGNRFDLQVPGEETIENIE